MSSSVKCSINCKQCECKTQQSAGIPWKSTHFMNKKQILQGKWSDCGLNLAGSRPADSWNAESWKRAGQICAVIFNQTPRWKALLSYWLCCMFHSICLKMMCKFVSDLKIIMFLFSLYIDGSIVQPQNTLQLNTDLFLKLGDEAKASSEPGSLTALQQGRLHPGTLQFSSASTGFLWPHMQNKTLPRAGQGLDCT